PLIRRRALLARDRLGAAGPHLLAAAPPRAGDGARGGPGILRLPLGVQLDRALQPVVEGGGLRGQGTSHPGGEVRAGGAGCGVRFRLGFLRPVLEGVGERRGGGYGGRRGGIGGLGGLLPGLGLGGEGAGEGLLPGLLLRAEGAGATTPAARARRITGRADRDPLPHGRRPQWPWAACSRVPALRGS